MSIIDTIFQPVIGKYCWNVEKGYGSFLTFEFGEPHFKIFREPYISKFPYRNRIAARRHVAIVGDWHLWIYMCDWRFYCKDSFVGESESSDEEIKQIAFDLNGQILQNVEVTSTWNTIFHFDLGGRLETIPYPVEEEKSEPDELWMLSQPSGRVFTLRSDGKYNHCMGNEPRTYEWISIEETSS